MSTPPQLTERQELVVWLHHTKGINQLKKYSYIYYVSKRMKYAIVYIDADQQEELTKKLQKIKCVRQVAPSPRQDLSMNFDDVLSVVAARATSTDNN